MFAVSVTVLFLGFRRGMLELSFLQCDGGCSMLRLLDTGPAGQVVLFISDLQTHRERLLVGGAGLVRQPVLVPHLPAHSTALLLN